MPLLSVADRRPAALIAGAVLVLNGLGWGVLLLVVVPQQLSMGGSRVFGVGIGVTAFLLGVRHAFDVDHIAVIDNAVRKLVGERRRALDTGLWFALGHSTVVFALAMVIAAGVRAVIDPVQDEGSTLRTSLGVLGTMAAGSFLIVLGLVNLSALLGIAHLYRHWRAGVFDEAALEHHLHRRGVVARLLSRFVGRVTKPWHVYPLGVLMGLGFDTATQVALLVLAGGGAAQALPWYAVLVLPVLFAAGMVLFDGVDGAVMARAYGWAYADPGRRLGYNLVVTSLSVAIALVLGAVLLLQLWNEQLQTSALGWSASIELGQMGFAVVGVFVATWAAAVTWSRFRNRPSAAESTIAS